MIVHILQGLGVLEIALIVLTWAMCRAAANRPMFGPPTE